MFTGDVNRTKLSLVIKTSRGIMRNARRENCNMNRYLCDILNQRRERRQQGHTLSLVMI